MMAGGVAGYDLCRVAAGRASTLSATVHELHPRGARPGFLREPGLFLLREATIVGAMSDATTRALRICSFESRRAGEMEQLLRRNGASPTVVPSMREVPLEHNETAF